MSVAVLAAVTASCADERATTAAPRADHQNPATLVSLAYLRAQVGEATSAAPAATVLRFWREIQLATFRQAYARLSAELRSVIGPATFARAFKRGRSSSSLGHASRTELRDVATVYLQLQTGDGRTTTIRRLRSTCAGSAGPG